MSNYTQTTNFATKDALSSGNPLKVVKGTEINVEFANIATAVATKSDSASPTFTGTVTIPTLAVTGVATLTSQPILSSLTASKPVFTDASKGLVSTGTLGSDQGGTGVANNAAMTVTGSGNFAYTRTLTGTTNVTFPTTGTLATLAGTETFTNKTLTSPVIGGTPTGVGVLTSGTAVASTSGTSVDFTSIPSWVKRITVMFNGVSTTGTIVPLIQIGSGSFTTSGYISSSMYVNTASALSNVQYTTGFGINSNVAATAIHGSFTLSLLNSATNNWVLNGGAAGSSTAASIIFASGGVSLAGVLDRIRITTLTGVDTFDAGSINILYE